MRKVNLRKKGATTVNVSIAVAILGILVLFGFGIGASFFGLLNEGDIAPRLGGGVSGTGCSLTNDGFSNTTAITSSDQVIGSFDNPTIKRSLTNNKEFLDRIIEQSKARSINPAVLISFWGAEQSFGAVDKAFGCGVYGGKHLYPGDNKQVACGLDLIQYAMEAKKCNGADKAFCDERTPSSADWSTPAGENIWTRLLYHYVAAERKRSFDTLGYVSDSKENRIQFLNKLVPDQVQCNTGFASAGNANDVPLPGAIVDEAQVKKWMNNSNVVGTMAPHGIVLHYTAGSDVPGAVGEMERRSSFVHLIIDQQGVVRKLLPFNAKVRSGSGDGNTFAIGIEIVGADATDLMKRSKDGDPQFDNVIKTINWLRENYNIPNERGNPTLINRQNPSGIFGHQQLQGNDVKRADYKTQAEYNIARWAGYQRGCTSRKIDPGAEYMNAIWNKLGSKKVDPVCTNLK